MYLNMKQLFKHTYIVLLEILVINITENSEIFARDLFSQNLTGAKFSENKPLTKW